MTEVTATAKPVTANSRTAARLSFAAAVAFLVLLAALHFIKPELDPSWRMVSEYEIGRYGWVMVLALLSLAFSCTRINSIEMIQRMRCGEKEGADEFGRA